MDLLHPVALLGGGELAHAEEVLAAVAALVQPGPAVLLPTASAFGDLPGAVAAATAALGAFGFEVAVAAATSRAEASDAQVVAAVAAASSLWLLDGSALHLRTVLRATPLLEAILAAHQRGAVVVGVGAGAEVLCEPMVDPRGGGYTTGLGLLPGMAVVTQVGAPESGVSPAQLSRTVTLAPPEVLVLALAATDAVLLGGPHEVRDFGHPRRFLAGQERS